MTGTVGIKQANGSFYSLVEANSAAKKHLLLTTAHDNQKSVQIDLYKSAVKSMADALYIGSIVVENITPTGKGKASIEMTVSSGTDGSITVDAVETGNPSNEYHLSISLNSLEEDSIEYPDFEGDGNTESSRKKVQVKGRKFPWLTIVLIVAVLALICLALWYFLLQNPLDMSWPQFGSTGKTAAPEVAAAGIPGGVPVETAAETVQPVVIERPPEPAAVTETTAPTKSADQAAGQTAGNQTASNQTNSQPANNQTASSQPAGSQASNQAAASPAGGQTQAAASQTASRTADRNANRVSAPQTIPPEGFTYRVRWGDTLWDIAEAFYRNPRLYPAIVRSNSIPNPNRIISGTELIIPPKN